MQGGNGFKLFFALLLGFLLVEAGLTGLLGSMIGAIIDPQDMIDSSTAGNGQGTGGPGQ